MKTTRKTGIFLAMVVCTVGLAGNPVLALYMASKLTDTNAPVAGPYAITALWIIAGTIALCYLLGHLVKAYNSAVGYTGRVGRRPGELSTGAAQDPGSQVLGHVLMVAFAIAGVCLAIWFFFFAGSSI